MDEFDLTDVIAEGNLSNIINVLLDLQKKGYEEIYFDGYEASITAYLRSKKK